MQAVLDGPQVRRGIVELMTLGHVLGVFPRHGRDESVPLDRLRSSFRSICLNNSQDLALLFVRLGQRCLLGRVRPRHRECGALSRAGQESDQQPRPDPNVPISVFHFDDASSGSESHLYVEGICVLGKLSSWFIQPLSSGRKRPHTSRRRQAAVRRSSAGPERVLHDTQGGG